MKRFWLVLLSLGLIVAFSTSAMAVDVKFSGEYYVAGLYQSKATLKNDSAAEGPSTAFYFQRLRVRTDFVVSPGLSLITRFDAMERAWGAARSAPSAVLDTQSQGTTAENENIAFDMAYVQYVSPIGIFTAGYQSESTWATVFGNSPTTVGKIGYTLPIQNFTLILQLVKHAELSRTAKFNSTWSDADYNAYYVMVLYKFKQGTVGISNFYLDNRTNRGLANYKDTIPLYVVPFLQAKFGPVAVQAEFLYQYGERKYESPSTTEDRDIRQMAGWIDATADFGMFYVGGSGAYISGDDFSTDKIEGGNLTGGRDWNPCLIMFNSDRQYWAGNQDGHNATANGAPMTNAYFAQLRAGVRPIDKLDIMASVSYATADKTPQAVWDSREYGYEIDLTATYKITNNLSYMLGGGYWMVGDYYKGTAAAGQDVDDNFMVINKLTLTF